MSAVAIATQKTEQMTVEELIKLESGILSRIVDDHQTRNSVSSILNSHDFVDNDHKAIMRAVKSLTEQEAPIDSTTVNNWLNNFEPKEGRTWASIVGTLETTRFETKPVYHAKIIKQESLKRRMKKELEAALVNLERQDPISTLETLSERIEQSVASVEPSSFKSFAEIKETTLEEIRSGNSKSVVLSGLSALDSVSGGFREGNLIVIAARPAMGKSALMSTVARNIASQGLPTYVFSLEMEATEIVDRMVSGDVSVANGKIINRNLDEYERDLYLDKIGEVEDIPLYVYDRGGITINLIKSELRKAQKSTGVGAVFVDYIQLVSSVKNKSNREAEVSEISRTLKALAKELKCPVFALSQLNRSLESTEYKVPELQHLRESGAIEQDADKVMFLWRPAYYGFHALPFDPLTNQEDDTVVDDSDCYIKLAKNRSGNVSTCLLTFQGIYARFTDKQH